jgi:hypothetical protein
MWQQEELSKNLETGMIPASQVFFLETQYKRKRSYTRAYTHLYERTHAHPIPMSTFERLSRRIGSWDWRSHHRRLAIDGNVASLKEYSAIIRHTHVKPGVWSLMGWGYNYPPNHSTSGWFSSKSSLYKCRFGFFLSLLLNGSSWRR